MNYINQLFRKGRFHLLVGYALLIETQKQYLVSKTPLVQRITAKARQELALTDPDIDHSATLLTQLTQDKMKLLTTQTNIKAQEVQNMLSSNNQTYPYTAGILGLGAITYFTLPSIYAFIVAGYLSALTLDLAKSLAVLRFDVKPAWQSRTGDLAYLTTAALGVVTVMGLSKAGVARLRQSLQRAIVLRQNPPKKD